MLYCGGMIIGTDSAIMHAIDDGKDTWVAETFVKYEEGLMPILVDSLFFLGVEHGKFKAPTWWILGDHTIEYFPVRLITSPRESADSWRMGSANVEKNLPEGIFSQEAVNIEGVIQPAGTKLTVVGMSDRLVPKQKLVHRLTTGWYNKTFDDVVNAYRTDYLLQLRPIERLFMTEYQNARDRDETIEDIFPYTSDYIL